jgi:hypothetical protein
MGRPVVTGTLQCRACLAVAALTLCAGSLQAQEDQPINTERPGFSSSPVALQPGAFQVEAGYQYSQRDNNLSNSSVPLTLLRVGLLERVELQLGWSGITWADANNRSTNGANDASVGVKWQATAEGAALPIALFAGVSLPVGASEFTSDSYDPTLAAFWSHSAGLDWFGTVLLSKSNDDTTVTNAIGLNLPLLDDIGVFVEYYGTFAGDGGPEHYLDGGITYLARNDLQLDLNLGAGLNDRAADFFIGAGLSYRF